MFNKGQGTNAGSIAVLIILIALFVAVYVLMLPPEERLALLNQTDEDGAAKVKGPTYLLEPVNPGLIKPFERETTIHKIDSISLYVKTEPIISDLASSLYVSKSLFSEKVQDLNFDIEDLDDVEKVNLFFMVRAGDENLIIELNGIEIFYGIPKPSEKVDLPIGLLSKQNNNLRFKVSSPGVEFWGKNYYRLTDIKIKESYEIENTKEERSVVLSKAEEDSDAKLSYFLFSNNPSKSKGARLRIFVNDKEISSEMVGSISGSRTNEVGSDDLIDGKNKIMFEIDKGDFLINNIELETKVKEGGAIKYEFVVTSKLYDSIISEEKDAVLYLNFGSDGAKKASIDINNNKFTLETDKDNYKSSVSDYMREGNNYIKIIPINEFEIDDLEIKLE